MATALRYAADSDINVALNGISSYNPTVPQSLQPAGETRVYLNSPLIVDDVVVRQAEPVGTGSGVSTGSGLPTSGPAVVAPLADDPTECPAGYRMYGGKCVSLEGSTNTNPSLPAVIPPSPFPTTIAPIVTASGMTGANTTVPLTTTSPQVITSGGGNGGATVPTAGATAKPLSTVDSNTRNLMLLAAGLGVLILVEVLS